MDWTKPRYDARPMGVEWLAECWAKTRGRAGGANCREVLRRGSDRFEGAKCSTVKDIDVRNLRSGVVEDRAFAGAFVEPNTGRAAIWRIDDAGS